MVCLTFRESLVKLKTFSFTFSDSLMSELEKKLPALKCDRGQDFQWKRPLPPAKVTSQDPVALRPERHQCESVRLAKKKMHHFTSVGTRVN